MEPVDNRPFLTDSGAVGRASGQGLVRRAPLILVTPKLWTPKLCSTEMPPPPTK